MAHMIPLLSAPTHKALCHSGCPTCPEHNSLVQLVEILRGALVEASGLDHCFGLFWATNGSWATKFRKRIRAPKEQMNMRILHVMSGIPLVLGLGTRG